MCSVKDKAFKQGSKLLSGFWKYTHASCLNLANFQMEVLRYWYYWHSLKKHTPRIYWAQTCRNSQLITIYKRLKLTTKGGKRYTTDMLIMRDTYRNSLIIWKNYRPFGALLNAGGLLICGVLAKRFAVNYLIKSSIEQFSVCASAYNVSACALAISTVPCSYALIVRNGTFERFASCVWLIPRFWRICFSGHTGFKYFAIKSMLCVISISW